MRDMRTEDFYWGVSQSGFQFEMGDLYRRFLDTRSDWWVWVRDPANIKSGLVSGDLPEDGVDYWEFYKEDHKTAHRLGLNAYRIGVEWSRVFPCPTYSVRVNVELDSDGLVRSVSLGMDALEELDKLADKGAVNWYREVLTDIRERGMEPFVCLNHFTLPIWIHDPIRVRSEERGVTTGWASKSIIVEFAKFAAYMAWKLGGLVSYWATFNEPMVVVELGYLNPDSGFPPGIYDPEMARLSLTNMVNAHSLAYDLVKEWCSRASGGEVKVGLIHNYVPVHPLEERDSEAAERYDYLHNEVFLSAVRYGFLDLNLDGSPEKKAWLSGKLDWVGLNYYTRCVVRRKEGDTSLLTGYEPVGGYGFNCEPRSRSRDGNPTSDFGWEVYPQGLLESIEALERLRVPVIVTENGVADSDDSLRPAFLKSHVEVLKSALNQGFGVKGYFHWSLNDNYEWAKGYSMKFGLQEVDLRTKERRPRPSAALLSKLIGKFEY